MSIFKAYDIRGTVPDQLNPEVAETIGAGFASFLIEECGNPRPNIVVARDMRSHSPEIAAAFHKGVCSTGANVIDAGLTTTPMLYAAVVLRSDVHGGAMITASHNGPAYNGMKLCRAEAVPISGTTGLKRIEELSSAPNRAASPGQVTLWQAEGEPVEAPKPISDQVNADLWGAYSAFAKGFCSPWPSGFKVAVDPANGAGCLYLPILRWLGLDVVSINQELDGSFPAHEANPIKAANLVPTQELVRSCGARLGIAFDGDADRVVFVDELGEAVPADLATAVLAREFLKSHQNAAILYDLRSSRAVASEVKAMGGRGVRERVGHSFMKATMRSEGCVFGGELSGHYYFQDTFNADSSLRAAIAMLNLLASSDKPLSVLINNVRRFHQSGEINFIVADKDAIMRKVAESFPSGEVDHLDGVTVQFPNWWLNLRPSNTEPLLRLNVEAESTEMLSEKLSELRAMIGGEEER
ncbi:MAG: phosphomannomutase/phosphoglucomutase [Planctomycetes bacterium]|nr:phosphomannomutase/phosphoglucomutase [Planctomycetota bacterium]